MQSSKIDCASLPWMGELLCVCDCSWFRFCGRPSCFACAIDRVFVAADGRGLVARSLMIACGFEVCAANPPIRGLCSKSSDPMFSCAILGLLRQVWI